MKRIFLMLFGLMSLFASAQQSDRYLQFRRDSDYADGYIVDKDGRKHTGLVFATDEDARSVSVIFVSQSGLWKIYRPREINGYGFSIYNYVSNNTSFLEVIRETEKIGLYRHFGVLTPFTSAGAIGPTFHTTDSDIFFVKRPVEKSFKKVSKRNFYSKFASYFADCEPLKSLI